MKNTRSIDLPKEIFKLPILERFLARLTYNKNADQLIARLAPLYRAYPQNSIRKVNRNGINYELDISDYMEWLVFYGILVEPRNTLYQLLKVNDVALDVGANIGEVSFNMAKCVGSSGVIHSFEPEPFIFSKLLKNNSLNSFVNIFLNNLALGDKVQELYLQAQVENNRGGTRIQPDKGLGKKVTVSTIDIYLEEKRLQKLDVIKIDVEGFELKVLQGAKDALKKFKPILFIEVNNNNLIDQGDSASALINYLMESGYSEIENAANKTKISPLMNFESCHFDIVAR